MMGEWDIPRRRLGRNRNGDVEMGIEKKLGKVK